MTLVFRIKRGTGIIGENKKRVGRKQTKKKRMLSQSPTEKKHFKKKRM